jgi:hypothetical protein
MQIHALLETRRAEILTELEKLQAELAEIDRMMGNASVTSQVVKSGAPVKTPATKDDAILQAIADGNRTPATISEYMRQKLGMPVNDASTRTRLSRMKSAEKIDLDGAGWKLRD